MTTTRSVRSTAPGNSALLGGLLDSTPDMIAFKDVQGRYLRVSASLARRMGLADPADAIGRTAFDFFPKEAALVAQADDTHVLMSGDPIIGKRDRLPGPDGREVWHSTTRLPLRDAAGAIVGTIAVSRDVTARVAGERALAEREEAIERDLDQAWGVLQELLPGRMPEHPRLEVKVHYSPMSGIGGDFVALPEFPGGVQGVFLGDLMGHGVAAAVHMALLKFLCDRLFVTFGTDPKGYLEHLNRQVRKQMRSTFVAGCYGVFRFRRGSDVGRLTIAGCGHHGVLVERAAGGLQLQKLPGNAALGITDRYQTDNLEIPLSPGDRAYLFTDGLPDTFDPRQKMLGMESLTALFRETRGLPLAEAFEHVLGGVAAFRAGAPASDDIVLAGFEVKKFGS
jgi:PAS domain S-box-containing protein